MSWMMESQGRFYGHAVFDEFPLHVWALVHNISEKNSSIKFSYQFRKWRHFSPSNEFLVKDVAWYNKLILGRYMYILAASVTIVFCCISTIFTVPYYFSQRHATKRANLSQGKTLLQKPFWSTCTYLFEYTHQDIFTFFPIALLIVGWRILSKNKSTVA